MAGSLTARACLVFALALAACTSPEGHPPVARAGATPQAIPENDEFQTAVTLDGAGSADPIDDPESAAGLDYHWEIWGDEHRFDQGDSGSVAPVLRFRGDRPATIELTVTDVDGLSGSARFQLQLTLSP